MKTNRPNITENILISLRQEQYELILNGSKKYEYRTRFTKNKTRAFVYISKTIKKIVAIIDFDTPIKGTCHEIAKFAQDYDEADYDEFVTWLNGRECNAIPIENIYLIKPIEISVIKENFCNFTVPQSYYKLNQKEELLNFLTKETQITNIIKLQWFK